MNDDMGLDNFIVDTSALSQGFTIIINEIYFSINKKSNTYRNLYVSLLSFKNNQSNNCYPSYTKLQERSNMSRPTIAEGLKYLEDKGYIEITKRKKSDNNYYNVYKFLNPFKGKGLDFKNYNNKPTKRNIILGYKDIENPDLNLNNIHLSQKEFDALSKKLKDKNIKFQEFINYFSMAKERNGYVNKSDYYAMVGFGLNAFIKIYKKKNENKNFGANKLWGSS